MLLLPSLASAAPLCLGAEMDRLNGWPYLHFDIEDGNFTPNLTFGQKTLGAVAKRLGDAVLDVHLMVASPLDWLPALQAAGAGRVCAHLEALRFPLGFINAAKAMGMRAGLALNFATPLSALEPFLPEMDFALIMTAEPDGAGENLNPRAFQKALIAAQTLPVDVLADGGLGEEQVLALRAAGAAGCVLGRLVFRAQDPYEQLTKLTQRMEESL